MSVTFTYTGRDICPFFENEWGAFQNESLMIGLCVFAEVIVMLVPCEGSETYVNGKRVEGAIQLRSGTYLILQIKL